MKTPELRTLHAPNALPGIYAEMPPEARCAWDCPGLGGITLLAQGHSLRRVRHNMLHRTPETPALIDGTLLHMAVIEPHAWATEMGDAPVNPKTDKPFGSDTKAYHDALGEWKQLHPHGRLLTPDDRARIETWRDAVYRCPEAQELLSATPYEWREYWMVWEEPTTGMKMRMRGDGYAPQLGVPWDLKTTNSLLAADLQRTIDEHGYDIQDALTVLALEDMGHTAEEMRFVFLDKGNANEVVVKAITEEWREMAYADAVRALSRFREAYATGEWPTYPSTRHIEPRRFRKRALAA